MKIKRCTLLILAVLAMAIYPIASYTGGHGHGDHGPIEKTALDKQLDEWLERLEDGWIPLFFLEDEDLER
jgi:hypothetical protein